VLQFTLTGSGGASGGLHIDVNTNEAHVLMQLGETLTAPDGTFVIYAPPPAAVRPWPDSLRVTASAPRHRPATIDAGPRAFVEISLQRLARMRGTLVLPPGVPTSVLRVTASTSILSSDSDRQTHVGRISELMLVTCDEAANETRTVEFGWDEIPPGGYDVAVHFAGLDTPAVTIHAVPFPSGVDAADPRLQGVDLRGKVHHYALRAVAAGGGPLTDLASPLLVQVDGESWRAFNWRGGTCEFFAGTSSLETCRFESGYRLIRERITAGETELVYQPLQPVEVLLPGLRSLCGSDRKVRISMILESDTGLPQGIQGLDQLAGETRHYSRWHLSKSGGAWLDDDDLVAVPLVHDGRYQIVVRLHQEGVGGDASINIGSYDVVLSGTAPQRLVPDLDLDRIREGLAQLEQRAERRPR
jgi:hypothetical protein